MSEFEILQAHFKGEWTDEAERAWFNLTTAQRIKYSDGIVARIDAESEEEYESDEDMREMTTREAREFDADLRDLGVEVTDNESSGSDSESDSESESESDSEHEAKRVKQE